MIWRPPLVGTLGYLVGMKWPEGNEDLMWGLADDWRSAASQLQAIKGDIDDAIAAVKVAYPEGDGGKEMIKQLETLKSSGDSQALSIDNLVKWFDSVASMADGTGTELEYTKLMFHATLLIMATEMAIAAASLFAAPVEEAGVIAANRITVRILMKRLINYLVGHEVKWAELTGIKAVLAKFTLAAVNLGVGAAVGAGLGAAPDAAIQAWQRYEGRRTKFDWGEVGTMALAGGVGGLVAAPAGAVLGKGLKPVSTKIFGENSRLGTMTVAGLQTMGTGAIAGLAGWGATALATGNTELDPRMITAGAVGGLGSHLMKTYGETKAPAFTNPSETQVANQTPSAETHPASVSDIKSDTAVHDTTGDHTGQNQPGANSPGTATLGARPVEQTPHADNGNGLTNLQSAGGGPVSQVAPNAHNGGAPRVSDAVQPSTPAHTTGGGQAAPEGRSTPTATATPRSESPTNLAPAAEGPKAGAAPTRDAGIGTGTQAKATGLEAATQRPAADRAQIAAQEHAAGLPPERSETARPTDEHATRTPEGDRPDTTRPTDGGRSDASHAKDSDASHAKDSDASHTKDSDKPESRIGGKGHDNSDQPSDRTHDGNRDGHDEPSHDTNQPNDHESHTPAEHPDRPVLPEDRPITDAERLHAQDALERLGHEADPSTLLHHEDTDQAGAHSRARENHEWWHSLTEDQQAAMTRVHPREIGNADGIPAPVRDQANRLSIARDMAELRANNPRVDKFTNRFFDPDGYREYKNLSKTVDNLRLADKLADEYAKENGGHRPPVQVLSYDARAFNGEGRAVVAFGDVDKASTVSFHIPGITTTVRSLKVNLNNSFNHYWETSRNTEDPGAVASIAWIGYDAPSGVPKIFKEMTNADLAKRGGQLLARDLAAFNETRKQDAALPDGSAPPDVHIFGHSYGSTTTSFAGAGGRLAGEVSTITLLGSPGAGIVPHASRFGIGDNVFVASSPRDPVTWIGSSHPDDISRAAPALGLGLGLDPSVDSFGARRITAQFPGGIRTLSDIGTHTGYYKFHDGDGRSVPSESLYNFGKIAAGRPDEVIPEFARPERPDLNDWQRSFGSTPRDPAHLRPPVHDPVEGAPHGYDSLVDEYRNPDPVAEHTPQLPTEHSPSNDCGPQALQHAQELTGNPNIHIPDDPQIAHRGMSADELENAAGAHMQPIDTPGVLADQLYRMGDGATAIVVDEFHGPADQNGVGAHAYTVTNDGGLLVIHDPALGEGPHPFPGDRTNVANTHAIIYDAHGNPLHPLESGAPAHPAATRPEARIGQPDSHRGFPDHNGPHLPEGAEPQRPKLPVKEKPYYANPHYEDPAASHEYAAKNRISDGEVQDIRAEQTAKHPEISRLTDAEIDAIRRNQFFHLNEPVNDATRNGNTHALHDRDVEIRTLISGYNKLPDYHGVVYRSLYIDDPVKLSRFVDDYQQGKTPFDPGFASSDKEGSMPGGNIELIIDSAFGKDISWASGQQDEVVFPPGNKFLVKDQYRVEDRYGNEKIVIELQDLGRTDHEQGGIRPNRSESDGAPQAPVTGGPEVGGQHPPAHGRPGEEGTPPSHRGPDQDLASVGRIGDQPDQPRAGRDGLAPEEPTLTHPNEVPHPEEPHRELPSHINGPDEYYVPFLGDSGQPHPDSVQPHPTEQSHPEQATPHPEPEKPHQDSREQSPHSEPTNDTAHPNAEHEPTAQEPIQPAEPETVAPAHDPIQRFDTPEAARHYGDEMLAPIRDTMSEPELRELQRYTKKSWINEFLRAENPVRLLAKLAEDEGHYQQLRRVTNGSPIMPRVEVLDRILAEHPDPRDPRLDPRLRATIEHVVNDPNPHGRLQELSRNADKLPMMREYFGGEPTMDVLRSHVERLDQAMNRPIPEGVEVSRGISMRSLDRFIGPDGQPLNGRNPMLLKGTVQTEHGYMSTSLGPTPPQEFRLKVRVELEIPADSKGAWVGDKGLAGPENELILQRESKFLITDVIEDPKGARYDDGYVDYLVKGKLVPADYVHEPSVEVPQAHDPNATPDRPGTDPSRPIGGPDKDVPLRLDNEPQRPVESPDRPSTLTPHLIDRFKELHERLYDLASAYHDPARAPELPGLRLGLNDLMDKLGMLDPTTSPTAMRLFEEYRPDLAKYLAENHDTFRPHPSDTATRPHEPDQHPTDRTPEPSEHRPTDPESRPNDPEHHPNADDPQPNASHPIDEHNPPADPLSHYADRTPAGLSLHNDPELHALAHQVPEDPRFFTIDAHLTDRGTILLDGREYTMEELAARLPELGYDGRPIRLIGCDAASTDAAARLAKATRTGVLAPTKPAWTDDAGHVYSSTAETTPEGTRRPRIPPDGDWEFIHPDGTKVKVSEDGFVPGTREEDKQDIDTASARDRGDDGASEPQYDLPGKDRVIHEDDSDFDDLFVEWNRPTHKPPDPLNPHLPRQPIDVHEEIRAPHRDRETVPDGNTEPGKLKPVEHPEVVPEPLRAHFGDEPLKPWSAYPVINENGTRTTFFTNGDGTVKWVEATPGSRELALDKKGPWSGFNPDLSFPLLPDVQYQVPNVHNNEKLLSFHTDAHGQTDALTGDIEAGGQNKSYRDDDSGKGAQQRAYQEGEAAYPSNPGYELTGAELERSRIKWAGGHLLANELGGLGEYLNMHPQMAASNSGNRKDGWVHEASWRAKENQLVAFAKEEHQEIRNYQVKMTREADGVPSDVIMRWQEVTYVRNGDGSVHLDVDGKPVVQSVVTKERVFPNREANFGPQDRYKNR
ncbi:alpha/beta hydrolase [Nocardia sp. CDC153]|uniref:alpha/beta hydrolase n=1 Tax=Nocardia sp. CDC153 TaxID=3112167 RepID=UPI002DB94339|nr:alpha/beta hydrolase [Nocardia sp. CDC153]MEC3955031.1 alpha/beta hydrolase [Nocardia sp. CDC153]